MAASSGRKSGIGLRNRDKERIGRVDGQDVARTSAKVGTELVAVEDGLDERNVALGGLKEAGGVEVGVADEFVQSCVEFVGAAGRGHVDGGSGGTAILGALVVGHYLKLGDGVRRRSDDLIIEALVALAVSIVVRTVEQEVVENAALAVDVIGALAHEAGLRGGEGRSWSLAGTGNQAEQIGVVAGTSGRASV
jgi:hypothetical protein